jgi:hypothetical protein
MKINSTVFTVIVISLVAIVSYYIGVSNQSVNSDQQSPLSNTLPIVPKQAKAVEAKPEPCIPNNRVTTTLPSLPKEEVFNIPTKQTTNQPIYDKHNWPSGATGYVHTKDGGYTWIYTNPNQEQSVTSNSSPVVIKQTEATEQNPTQIITDRFKKTQQYIQSQQQTELDVFRITRFRSREEAIDELNQINLKYQQLLNQEKFKSDQQIGQLKRIQSLIDAGQIDSAAGNEAMWRMVFPLETNPIPNYAAEASATTEKVKRKLIATQQQQEELARQQQRQWQDLAQQQQRQRQETMNRLDEIECQQQRNKWQQQWNDMERDNWQLKYNYFDNKWQYAPQNSQLRYNCLDNSWQYVPSR